MEARLMRKLCRNKGRIHEKYWRMKAEFSIKLILYFAPNCPQQIVAPNCPTPNSLRRIIRAELSAPNCPAPNCPAPNCPAPNCPDTPTQHSPIPVSWHAWHGILWYYFLSCATIMNALFCTTSGHAQRACTSTSSQEE